jgi:methionyl-tRNA formyltransferase
VNSPVRVVCLMYQSVGEMALRYFLEETQDQVVALFTHQDTPGEEIWWRSAADLARAHGVPVFTPEDINQPEWVERIGQMQPDFIFSAWYRNLIRRPILDIPPRGCYNLHGSLLPYYRGRAPVNWVLVNGEAQTGMTLHVMTPRADAGEIVGQAVTPIWTQDTAQTLYDRLVPAGLEVLRAAWPLLREGRAPHVAQDESRATVVGRRGPEDGRFAWDWPAARIHNLVRAVTHPYPGAFVDTPRGRLTVWASRAVSGLVHPPPPAPGTVVCLTQQGPEITTGLGRLLVLGGQVAGQDECDGAELARRLGLESGTHL